jgi:hypothetical protein
MTGGLHLTGGLAALQQAAASSGTRSAANAVLEITLLHDRGTAAFILVWVLVV